MTAADDPDTNADTTDEEGTEGDTDDERTTAETDDPLPRDVVDEAERLTRRAREAVDDGEAEAYRERRGAILTQYDYTARVREDERRDVLVLHPDEWTEDGLVQVDRIEDIDRGVEVPLSGPSEGDEWEAIDEHNREIVAEVAERHDEIHAANVEAFADFMSNHYARPIESATAAQREEFLTEYFPRNAWPSDEQHEVVEKSLDVALEVASEGASTESPR